MKIINLNLKNKVLELKNLNFNFDKCGIYIITGQNGVGKTSIIEKIVFKDNEIKFNIPSHSESYKTDRFNLFTYIPQNIIVYDIPVIDYLTKGNTTINKDNILHLIKSFNLENINLHQKFNELSGGERIKLAIISGLIKETPFVFMDEPTNNLDDSSVECLTNIIENISKDRTIIIVSHDPRLKFKEYHKVNISEEVEVLTLNTEINVKEPKKIKPRFLKLASGIFRSKINYLFFFLSIIVVLFASYYSHIKFMSDYSTDKVPPSNIIFTYKVDYVYGELNKVYVQGEGLNIDTSNKYRMIGYDDVPNIAKIKGVDKIIISDYSFLDKASIDYIENKLLDNLTVISCPEYLTKDINLIDYSFGLRSLERGRLPLDNKNEISLSKNQLKKYFNYNDEMIRDAIGKKIKFDNKEFTIVGLSYNDFGTISFDSERNLGFYQYESRTYNEFTQKNMNYKKSIDAIYPNVVNELIIYTEKGKEKSVLNKLFELYPAENYFSSEYVKTWSKTYNHKVINEVLTTNLLYCIFISVSLFLISKNQLYINLMKINDYENYYIDKRKIKRMYLLLYLIQYIVVLLLSMLLTNFSQYNFLINNILLLDLIILFIPTFIYSIWRVKNV